MVKEINQMSSQKKKPNIKSNKEHKQDVKIDLDGKKDRPDVKLKGEGIVKTKPNIESNKEHKQDVKSNIEFNKESKPDMITYEEEKVALVLGITAVFTVWWMFK